MGRREGGVEMGEGGVGREGWGERGEGWQGVMVEMGLPSQP